MMYDFHSLKALSLIILLLKLQAICQAAPGQNQRRDWEVDGKNIPADVVSDYNKFHDPSTSGNIGRRQVPGAHCLQDNLLAAAQQEPYWTNFCASFIGAPTSLSTAFITPIS